MDEEQERARAHAELAEQLLNRIKTDKALGRGMDVKDAQNATVAGAHAALALYYQRAEPER